MREKSKYTPIEKIVNKNNKNETIISNETISIVNPYLDLFLKYEIKDAHLTNEDKCDYMIVKLKVKVSSFSSKDGVTNIR